MPLLQAFDLVQKTQRFLLFTLESSPNHLQFSVHRRLFAHVPDRLHAFLKLGRPDPPLFDRQLDPVLLELDLRESLFESIDFLFQPKYRCVDFLRRGSKPSDVDRTAAISWSNCWSSFRDVRVCGVMNALRSNGLKKRLYR